MRSHITPSVETVFTFIHSEQNQTFKQAVKLASSRRERLKQQQTLLDGPHLLASWLDAGRQPLRLFVTAAGLESPEIAALVERSAGLTFQLDEPLFKALSELPSTTGIIAQVAMPATGMPRQAGFCLALDGIQDPGNVGSILRSAAAAGVDQVWLSPACADAWSPKVLRAGMGAHAVLDIIERCNLHEASSRFSGRIAATLLEGAVNLHEADWRGDVILVMGSEGAGVSEDIASLANLRVRIPMAEGIESLNVAAAAAICLFERVRQNGL